jgi:glutamyl-tRNA synthetase
MNPVRTRFAPSPTGYLHVGSARTAIFNWAFSRRHGGRFLLRIEDTDRQRSTPESERAVLEGLRWLGLQWDEEPVRQSERRGRHEEAIEELLHNGHAYRCICTPAEIEQRKEAAIAAGRKWVYDGRCRERSHGPDCGRHTVRLRLPAHRLEWNDLVFGPSGQEPREIGDAIIRRSDGSPLYHLAVVVDDLDMGISHVIRGADHHPNTPLQLAIYEALERRPPAFAHLPLIVGADGKKLSKRRDPVAVRDYRDQGYLAEALRNWLVRIGWSHGDQEIFALEEIGKYFDLASVNRSHAQADPAKLLWLNEHYIKTLDRGGLFQRLQPYLEEEAGQAVTPTPRLLRLLDLLRERSKTLPEMARFARFLVVNPIEVEEKAARKYLRPAIAPLLADLHAALDGLEEWSETSLEKTFEEVRGRHGDVAMGKIAQPVRVAITGRAASPGIFETLEVLGKERSVERIGLALKQIREAQP